MERERVGGIAALVDLDDLDTGLPGQRRLSEESQTGAYQRRGHEEATASRSHGASFSPTPRRVQPGRAPVLLSGKYRCLRPTETNADLR